MFQQPGQGGDVCSNATDISNMIYIFPSADFNKREMCVMIIERSIWDTQIFTTYNLKNIVNSVRIWQGLNELLTDNWRVQIIYFTKQINKIVQGTATGIYSIDEPL